MAWRQGMYVLIEDVIWAISCPIVSLTKIRARGLLDFYFVVVFMFYLFVCFLMSWYFCFSWNKRDGISFIAITPKDVQNISNKIENMSEKLKVEINYIGGLLCLNMLYCFNQGFCSNKTYLKVIAKRFLCITEPRKNVIR